MIAAYPQRGVLEQIVGQIEDEHDERVERRIEADDVELDGATRVRELETDFGIEIPADAGFETLAGFLLFRLGDIPRVGDAVEYQGRRYTVLQMERNRVARVRIEKLPEIPVATPGEGGRRVCWESIPKQRAIRGPQRRCCCSLWLVYMVRSTLFVFILAVLFAYLLSPLVNLLDRFLPTRTRTPALGAGVRDLHRSGGCRRDPGGIHGGYPGKAFEKDSPGQDRQVRDPEPQAPGSSQQFKAQVVRANPRATLAPDRTRTLSTWRKRA